MLWTFKRAISNNVCYILIDYFQFDIYVDNIKVFQRKLQTIKRLYQVMRPYTAW